MTHAFPRPGARPARRLLLGLLCAACLPMATAAQTRPAYLDNRSTPASLVRSLYNAISLKQYARAWSYFGTPKPAADYTAFAAGYAATGEVTVATGQVVSEGAAGSIYSTVPVAVSAVKDGGDVDVFAGCYLTRMLEPQIEAPDFQPLFIVKGHLLERSLAKGAPLDSVLPKSCNDDALPQF